MTTTAAEYAKDRRAKLYDAGLCQRCGKRPAKQDRSKCQPCLEAGREYAVNVYHGFNEAYRGYYYPTPRGHRLEVKR